MKLHLIRDRKLGSFYYQCWTEHGHPGWNPWIWMPDKGKFSFQCFNFKRII